MINKWYTAITRMSVYHLLQAGCVVVVLCISIGAIAGYIKGRLDTGTPRQSIQGRSDASLDQTQGADLQGSQQSLSVKSPTSSLLQPASLGNSSDINDSAAGVSLQGSAE